MALQYLRGAIALLRAGIWEPAVQDAYYACFHATLALLATVGASAETHRGVRQLLALHFAHTRLLPPELPRLLGQITTDREIAAYGLSGEVNEVAAREAAQRAASFLRTMLPLLAERAPQTAVGVTDLLTALPDLAAQG